MLAAAYRPALRAALVLTILAAAIFQPSRAQEPLDVKARYAKQEVMIPMRDGTKLFTIVYSPKDASERYPFMLTRTAYGIAPYGADNFRAIVGPS